MPKQNPKSSANSRPSMRAGRGAWNPRTFEQIGRDAPPHARSRDPQMSPACAQAPDDRIADTDYSTTLAEMARIHLYPISKARWSLNSFLLERDRYRRISAGIPLLKSPISATLVRVEIASRPPNQNPPRREGFFYASKPAASNEASNESIKRVAACVLSITSQR